MTLNDFYSEKLEGLLTLLEKGDSQRQDQFEQEFQRIEKIVKDNEVRIPYDEDIFIGIDRNYKTLKKSLTQIKDRFMNRNKITDKNELLEEKELEIEFLKSELEKYKPNNHKFEKVDNLYDNLLDELKQDPDEVNAKESSEVEESKETSNIYVSSNWNKYKWNLLSI